MIYNYISLLGARPKNEDEIKVIINSNNSDSSIKPLNFFAIFDGHGGNEISKYLRDNLYKYFLYNTCRDLDKTKTCNKYIIKNYDYIQNKLASFELPSKICGSTALVIINYPYKDNYNYLKVINLGDCRAVICNKYNIGLPLTKDHKPMSPDERIRIIKEGGTITQDFGDDPRINGLSVSRAFGDLDAKPHVSHIPDIYDYKITPGEDKFIIMGCDGVWDVLSNQEAVDFVLEKIESMCIEPNAITKSRKNIANLLGEYAIARGSQDNISVLIVWI